MANKNLLLMIIDTNPVLWSCYETIFSRNINNEQSKFTITDFINSCIGFINAYVSMNQDNAVALIAAHNTKAEYLYPSRYKRNDKSVSPWNRCEQILDINEQIKKNLENLISNEEMESTSQPPNNSTLTSAFGLALCYVNRIQKYFPLIADTVNFRILIVKLFEDAANQYMNFMNMIFTSEKLNIPIDSCVLLKDSSLLQQASNLTNGIYFKIPQINGLLHYLLWIYLPNENLRKFLVLIPKTQVDFRAACFCHRQLIDVGYVCSVCLSVFCSFTPICPTCDCNFEFDLNILKLGKKIDFNKKSTQLPMDIQNDQASIISASNASVASMLHDNNRQSTLSTSITQLPFQIPQAPISTALRNSNINQNSTSFGNMDDSFEMLE